MNRGQLLWFCAVLGFFALASASCGNCNRRATITSVSPTSATEGGGEFVLTVTGSNFYSYSRVYWNGFPLITTFVSRAQLTAEVPASEIAKAGSSVVFVSNPPGESTDIYGFSPNSCGGISNNISFTIDP